METYEFTIRLKVRVDAYSEQDAEEAINDVFGVGTDCGLEVVHMDVQNVEPTR